MSTTQPTHGEAERVPIERASSILGVPPRTVQALAARGEIPAAAKIGRRWTFDLAALRGYVKFRESQSCRSAEPRGIVIGGGIRSGGASRSRGARSGSAYEQTMLRLRKAASKPAGIAK